MISQEKIYELKKLLEESQNPLFFFDNDTDGLTSYLLLKRFLGRGKGFMIKSPSLDKSYERKISEHKPDKIFVLDKPVIDDEFVEETKNLGLQLIWLDHHPLERELNNITYFSPLLEKPESNEPVSYWCYKITKRDEWVTMLGCLGDWFLPEFAKKFASEHESIFYECKNAGDALYRTELGKLAKIISFAMKDKTSAVIRMMQLLEKARSAEEILAKDGYECIFKRYEQVNKRYEKLLERAKKISNKIIFFIYSGDLSISGELSNELHYLFPEKNIVVAYTKGSKVNLSFRGKKIREIGEKAMQGIEGSFGGHENAAGGVISSAGLEKFKNNFFMHAEKKSEK